MVSSVLAVPVAAYIRRHRDRLLADAVPLGPEERTWLSEYFPEETLDQVRILVRDPLPVAVPPLRDTVRSLGLDFPDIADVSAITFDSVIAARHEMSEATLFHELVHVVQYRLLGVREFARQYAMGLLSARRYEGIPLEQCAYQLEDRFVSGSPAFAVEKEVRRWLSANGVAIKPPRRKPSE